MTSIKAVIKDGKLDVQVPSNWPDGTEVLVRPIVGHAVKIGLDESEWRDDPAALADWDAWIRTIERFDEASAQANP